MFNDSFTQKLRRQLNQPLNQKNILVKLFLPILFFISFIIYLEAKRRRRNGYLKINDIDILSKINDIQVICIGNVLLGGTGKSPIVQKIAELFMNRNYVVAIASRGIGDNIKTVYVDSKQQLNKNYLSDENREHFEKLLLHCKSNNKFYILQNPNRLESLKYFCQQKNNLDDKTTNYVLLLDDGLQHFKCPRDINICAWDPNLLLQSPLFTIPIGPYREGFGKRNFENLLASFDFRLWSRTSFGNLNEYTRIVKNCIHTFNLNNNRSDIITCSETIFYEIIGNNSLNQIDLKNINSSSNNISIVTGIANPERFVQEIKQFFPHKNFHHYSLGDHGSLSKKAIDFINNSEVLVLTLKDYFRWCQHLDFVFAIKNKMTILCSIDVSFYNLNFEKEDILTKLIKFKR